MYKVLRQENDAIIALKQLLPGNKIPVGLLSEGPDAIKKALTDFNSARKADLPNEKRPLAKGEKPVEFKSQTSLTSLTTPTSTSTSTSRDDDIADTETPKVVVTVTTEKEKKSQEKGKK